MAGNNAPLERIYPGVRKDQKEFLDKEAKRLKFKDGELIRFIIDFYKTNKNKVNG